MEFPGMLGQRLRVPENLTDYMEQLAKEIIRNQPENLHIFAADFFAKLLELRDVKEAKRGESPPLDAPIRRSASKAPPTPKPNHLPLSESPHDEQPRPLQANIDLPAIDEESPIEGPSQLPVFLTVTKRKPTLDAVSNDLRVSDSRSDRERRESSYFTPTYKDGCQEDKDYDEIADVSDCAEETFKSEETLLRKVKFDEQDEQAATKIQASFRGFRTRRALATGAAVAGAVGIGFFPLKKKETSDNDIKENLYKFDNDDRVASPRSRDEPADPTRSVNGYYLLKDGAEASSSEFNIPVSSNYEVSEPDDRLSREPDEPLQIEPGEDTASLLHDESDDEMTDNQVENLIDLDCDKEVTVSVLKRESAVEEKDEREAFNTDYESAGAVISTNSTSLVLGNGSFTTIAVPTPDNVKESAKDVLADEEICKNAVLTKQLTVQRSVESSSSKIGGIAIESVDVNNGVVVEEVVSTAKEPVESTEVCTLGFEEGGEERTDLSEKECGGTHADAETTNKTIADVRDEEERLHSNSAVADSLQQAKVQPCESIADSVVLQDAENTEALIEMEDDTKDDEQIAELVSDIAEQENEAGEPERTQDSTEIDDSGIAGEEKERSIGETQSPAGEKSEVDLGVATPVDENLSRVDRAEIPEPDAGMIDPGKQSVLLKNVESLTSAETLKEENESSAEGLYNVDEGLENGPEEQVENESRSLHELSEEREDERESNYTSHDSSHNLIEIDSSLSFKPFGCAAEELNSLTFTGAEISYQKIVPGYDSQFLNTGSTHKFIEGMGGTLEETEEILIDELGSVPAVLFKQEAKDVADYPEETSEDKPMDASNLEQKEAKEGSKIKPVQYDQDTNQTENNMSVLQTDGLTVTKEIKDSITANKNDSEVEIIIQNSIDLDDEIASVLLSALSDEQSQHSSRVVSKEPSFAAVDEEEANDEDLNCHNEAVPTDFNNVLEVDDQAAVEVATKREEDNGDSNTEKKELLSSRNEMQDNEGLTATELRLEDQNSFGEQPKSNESLNVIFPTYEGSENSSLGDSGHSLATTTEGAYNDRSMAEVEVEVNERNPSVSKSEMSQDDGDDEVAEALLEDFKRISDDFSEIQKFGYQEKEQEKENGNSFPDLTVTEPNKVCLGAELVQDDKSGTEHANTIGTLLSTGTLGAPNVTITADDLDEDNYIWRKLQGHLSVDDEDYYVKAATKIQATYRGYSTRRHLRETTPDTQVTVLSEDDRERDVLTEIENSLEMAEDGSDFFEQPENVFVEENKLTEEAEEIVEASLPFDKKPEPEKSKAAELQDEVESALNDMLSDESEVSTEASQNPPLNQVEDTEVEQLQELVVGDEILFSHESSEILDLKVYHLRSDEEEADVAENVTVAKDGEKVSNERIDDIELVAEICTGEAGVQPSCSAEIVMPPTDDLRQLRASDSTDRSSDLSSASLQTVIPVRDMDENEAALKIQTAYRGFQARRQVQEVKGDSPIRADLPELQALNNEEKVELDECQGTQSQGVSDEEALEDMAATKIQAAFRGHQVRKSLATNDEIKLVQVPEEEITLNEDCKDFGDKSSLAELIDEGASVNHVRQNLVELNSVFPEESEFINTKTHPDLTENLESDSEAQGAALKIQAVFRGHQVRKVAGKIKPVSGVCEGKNEVMVGDDDDIPEEGKSVVLVEVGDASELQNAASELQSAASEVQNYDVDCPKKVHSIDLAENEKHNAIMNVETELIAEEVKDRATDSGPTQEQAAVKIQAAFRGHQVRKELIKAAGDSNVDDPNVSELDNVENKAVEEPSLTDASPSEEEAAVKIQAAFRGHQVRKELHKIEEEFNPEPKDMVELHKNVIDSNIGEPNVEDVPQLEEEAAIKIQAAFRGNKVRKEMHEIEEDLNLEVRDLNREELSSQVVSAAEEEAAVKIQAAYRGFQVRKSMDELKSATANETSDKVLLCDKDKKFSEDLSTILENVSISEEEAAKRIQCAYRAFKIRQQENPEVFTPAKDTELSQALLRTGGEFENQIDLENVDPEEQKAAVIIQSIFRGHQARKNARNARKISEDLADKTDNMFGTEVETILTSETLSEEEAAKRIQYAYRSFKSRQLDNPVRKNLGDLLLNEQAGEDMLDREVETIIRTSEITEEEAPSTDGEILFGTVETVEEHAEDHLFLETPLDLPEIVLLSATPTGPEDVSYQESAPVPIVTEDEVHILGEENSMQNEIDPAVLQVEGFPAEDEQTTIPPLSLEPEYTNVKEIGPESFLLDSLEPFVDRRDSATPVDSLDVLPTCQVSEVIQGQQDCTSYLMDFEPDSLNAAEKLETDSLIVLSLPRQERLLEEESLPIDSLISDISDSDLRASEISDFLRDIDGERFIQQQDKLNNPQSTCDGSAHHLDKLENAVVITEKLERTKVDEVHVDVTQTLDAVAEGLVVDLENKESIPTVEEALLLLVKETEKTREFTHPDMLVKHISVTDNCTDDNEVNDDHLTKETDSNCDDLVEKEASEIIQSIEKAMEEMQFIGLSHESPLYETPSAEDLAKFNEFEEKPTTEDLERFNEFEADFVSGNATDHSSNWSDSEQNLKDLSVDILNHAATKIQSQYRGYRTRQRIKRNRHLHNGPQLQKEGSRDESLRVDTPTSSRVPDLHGFGNCEELHTAATKIQAGVRGYLVRKAMRSWREERRGSGGAKGAYACLRRSSRRASDTTHLKTSDPPLKDWNPMEFSQQMNTMHEVVAATVIQAYYRGYKTRKQNKLSRKTKSTTDVHDAAATTIQSAFRGYKTRKGQHDLPRRSKGLSKQPSGSLDDPEMERAATKIQASYRGYKVRRGLRNKKPSEDPDA